MKLNLPSTLTSKKMLVMSLSFWLSASETEAGQAFKNCLTHRDNDVTSYDLIFQLPLSNNIDINSGRVLEICCKNSTQCLPVS
jgi:hypothetical protein